MKTFLFELNFTCPYTMEKRSRTEEYRAKDKQTALKGIQDYCNVNKNRLNCTFKLIK